MAGIRRANRNRINVKESLEIKKKLGDHSGIASTLG